MYNIYNFIDIIKGKKEIGLIVAENSEELNNFKNELISLNLKESLNLKDLFLNQNTFFHINNETNIEIIKYIREYRLGAIQLKSKTTKKFKWYYPDYSKLTLVLIMTSQELEEFNKLDILEYATTVYRDLNLKVWPTLAPLLPTKP